MKTKKFLLRLTVFGAVAIVTCLTQSCREVHEQPVTYFLYNRYRTPIVEKAMTSEKGKSYTCKSMKTLYFSSRNAVHLYELHDATCLAHHVEDKPDLYGTDSEWNHLNDYWCYKRKALNDTYDVQWDYKKATLTFSNGIVYHYTTEEKEGESAIVFIYNGEQQFMPWDDIKP